MIKCVREWWKPTGKELKLHTGEAGISFEKAWKGGPGREGSM